MGVFVYDLEIPSEDFGAEAVYRRNVGRGMPFICLRILSRSASQADLRRLSYSFSVSFCFISSAMARVKVITTRRLMSASGEPKR